MDDQSKWAPQTPGQIPGQTPANAEQPAPPAASGKDDASKPVEAQKPPVRWGAITPMPRLPPSQDSQVREEAESEPAPALGAAEDRGQAESDEDDRLSRASQGRPGYRKESPRERRLDSESDAFKIGILGGTRIGKTYLFQAMVYRLVAGESAGALSYYKPSSELWESTFNEMSGVRGEPKVLSLQKFLEPYVTWIPIKNTERTSQKWYRLRTRFRSGLLGTSHSIMDIDFLDGAGEGFEAPLGPETEETWKSAYSDARFMIFCLPIWAVFPKEDLSAKAKEDRKKFLEGFEMVVDNYLQIRNKDLKVQTMLALTMADDDNCSLRLLRERWIDPLVEGRRANSYMKEMRSRRGAARYLASARAISNYLYQRLDSGAVDVFLRRNINRLDLGKGPATIIPTTSLQGSILGPRIEAYNRKEKVPPLDFPPNPAHVELPLLAALCERHNILM